ncbi:histone-lysine N-methyltransferase SETMAR-like isoform X2 [Misgurnus anguillicaudatus]|uniref:histone-lysine N-methyltransferase SETMAR-like isoform X2 n=1 Tax=Misgurnus anguillicaudatus TaxID=75329 RepID=UPI003CCF3748
MIIHTFFKHRGRDYCIDASFNDGSLGRLVNDSEQPNGKMKKIELEGKPHLCLFSIKDINPGEEITYDYGGHDLPWRSCCRQELCKLVHEPVAAGSDDTSSKEQRGRERKHKHQYLSNQYLAWRDRRYKPPKRDGEND